MKIGKDKWRHFYVGVAMGIILQLFFIYFFSSLLLWGVYIVFFLVVFASYGFELVSFFTGKGHYDIVDAAAGVIGGVIGMGVAFLLYFLF